MRTQGPRTAGAAFFPKSNLFNRYINMNLLVCGNPVNKDSAFATLDCFLDMGVQSLKGSSVVGEEWARLRKVPFSSCSYQESLRLIREKQVDFVLASKNASKFYKLATRSNIPATRLYIPGFFV
jgi:hypothetical protein